MRILISLIALVLCASGMMGQRLPFSAYADSVWAQDFENRPADPEYSETDMIPDFTIRGLKPESWTVGLGTYDGTTQWKKDYLIGKYNASIVDVDRLANNTGDATRCLRIKHEAGCASLIGTNGTFPGTGSGAGWTCRIPEVYKELYLSYNVMKPAGAYPVKEQKNPALRGDFTWGNNVGFRAMTIMNRSEEFGHQWLTYIQDRERAVGRFRDPDTGDYFAYDWSDSTWYNLTFRVCVNTVGFADGLLEAFINGRMVSQLTNLELSIVDTYINSMIMMYMIGGETEDYRPPTDQFYHVDDMYLFNYKDGYGPDLRVPSQPGRTLFQLPNWDIEAGRKIERSTETFDSEDPSPPGNVSVTKFATSTIDLAWNAASDNVGIHHYTIYIDGEPTFTTPNLSFVIGGLHPATEYSIYVTASDEAGNESEPSQTISQTTEEEETEPPPPPPPPSSSDTESPSTPEGLVVENISEKTILLKWNPSEDNVGIHYYGITVDGDELFTTVDTFFTIGFLEANTTFQIYLVAYDVSGNKSSPSNSITHSIVSRDEIPPSAPTNIRTTLVSENTITLEWDESVDNNRIREYKIYLNNTEWESSIATKETLAGLQSGLSYDIHITALDDAANESQPSESLSVTTKKSDVTLQPAYPDITIIELQDQTREPRVTSEINSLGYVELENFGIEVAEKDNPVLKSSIIDGIGSTQVNNQNRITDGLELLYNFSIGEQATVIDDISGNTPSFNLKISREGLATEWLPGHGLKIQDHTSLYTSSDISPVTDAIARNNAFTLEAWVSQKEIHQSGLAHLISLCDSTGESVISLIHDGNSAFYNYLGSGNVRTGQNFTSLSLHHIVYTRNAQGLEKLFVNGIELGSAPAVQPLSMEGSCSLILANDLNAQSPWQGIFYLVAVYSRALNFEEILQNYESGSGQIQFTNILNDLESNVEYQLTPFIVSNQGLVYGEPIDFTFQTVAESDTLFSFYPNPSNGYVHVVIRNRQENVNMAYLRLADFSGNVHMMHEIDLSEGLIEKHLDVELPLSTQSGLYFLTVIAGNEAVTRKLVLYK